MFQTFKRKDNGNEGCIHQLCSEYRKCARRGNHVLVSVGLVLSYPDFSIIRFYHSWIIKDIQIMTVQVEVIFDLHYFFRR